jgi:glycosyltransferase involved in cell wall biosynthesis
VPGGHVIDPEPIDVVMCTWNSNKLHFRKCLLSIKKEVEVHHFIMIDRYSCDGTVEVVRSVFPNARIFQTTANLGTAQRIGIKHVDTRYFAFFDDDIELSEGWFRKIISLIKGGKQVAAVQGFTRYYPSYMDKARAFELSRQKGSVKEITDSGLTHDTVLMTETVKDLNPPQTSHSREDFLMTQHIIKKGYKWLETNQAQATHYRSANRGFLSDVHKNFLKEKWNGASDRLVRTHPSSSSRAIAPLLLNLLKNNLYSLIVSTVVSDPRIWALHFSGHFGYLEGFFSADENIAPHELHIARSTCSRAIVEKSN